MYHRWHFDQCVLPRKRKSARRQQKETIYFNGTSRRQTKKGKENDST
jgi:hypothetical protein